MNWQAEFTRIANGITGAIKTAPFPIMKMAYCGMLKQIEEKPQTLKLSDTLIIRRLIGFWANCVNMMKNNPEPTPELQAIQDKDVARLTEFNGNMVYFVIEPIRQRKFQEIKTEPIKGMIALLGEFEERYGQSHKWNPSVIKQSRSMN